MTWTADSDYQWTGLRYDPSPFTGVFSPRGGATVIREEFQSASLDIGNDEATGHGLNYARGDPIKEHKTVLYSLTWKPSLPSYFLDWVQSDGSVEFVFEVHAEQIKRMNGGVEYIGVDNPSFTVDFGKLIKSVVLGAVTLLSPNNNNRYWVYKQAFAGLVSALDVPTVQVTMQWECVHHVTDDIDTRVNFAVAIRYDYSAASISRYSPRNYSESEDSADDLSGDSSFEEV